MVHSIRRRNSKDDGASFRVRRETQLHAQVRRSMWEQTAKLQGSGPSGGLKIVLLLTFVAVVVPGSFLGWLL